MSAVSSATIVFRPFINLIIVNVPMYVERCVRLLLLLLHVFVLKCIRIYCHLIVDDVNVTLPPFLILM